MKISTRYLQTLFLLLIVILQTLLVRATANEVPTGFWLMPDASALLKIAPSTSDEIQAKQTYEIMIVAVLDEQFNSTDASDLLGKPRLDIHNPDRTLRDRALPGLKIGGDFHFELGKLRGGWIYNPESGNTYKAELSLEEDGLLRVKAFLGISFIGQTIHWRPALKFQESFLNMLSSINLDHETRTHSRSTHVDSY